MTTILVSAVLAVAMFVIAWAWVDGGQRPLRTIVEPVRPQAGASASAGAAQ